MRDHRRIYGDQVWRLEDDAADRIANAPAVPSALDEHNAARAEAYPNLAKPKCGTCMGRGYVFVSVCCDKVRNGTEKCPDCGADDGKESKR